METYAIAAHTWEDTKKKLRRIARKCEKYGNPFKIVKVGDEFRNVKDPVYGRTYKVPFILVQVEGVCKCGDWQAIAQLGVRESGNIVRMIDTTTTVPEEYRHTRNVCDHCNTERDRKCLYIIRNNKTGEHKQVGSTCLKDYCGIDLEAVVAWRDGLAELEDNKEKCEGAFDTWRTYVDTEKAVAAAITLTDTMGYRKSCSDELSTKDALRILLFGGGHKHLRDEYGINIADNAEDSEEVRERAKKVIAHAKECKPANTFLHNVKTVAKGDMVNKRDLGYVGYLPTMYAKDMELEKRREERAKAEKDAVCYGEVGKRYKDMPVTSMRCATSWHNDYGFIYLYEIRIAGAILMWRTTKYVETEGVKSIAFTVKGYKEFNGIKQTEVTRCKVA